MQLRYVFTELGQGLRRNLSMHIAVVLTLMVSLSLVGVGLLLHKEAQLTEAKFGSKVQIILNLCNGANSDQNARCTGPVTDEQRSDISSTLNKFKDSGLVATYHTETQQQAFQRLKDSGLLTPAAAAAKVVQPSDLWSTYWVQVGQPSKANEVSDGVRNLPGVDHVQSQFAVVGEILNAIAKMQKAALLTAIVLVVAALLLVSNTIRLAALARRREIGIMRLVGASGLYIALPFLLEALMTAVVGVALAGGALASAMWFGVIHGVRAVQWNEWVGWTHYWGTMGWVLVLGVVLTLLPTLLLTRKYLKV